MSLTAKLKEAHQSGLKRLDNFMGESAMIYVAGVPVKESGRESILDKIKVTPVLVYDSCIGSPLAYMSGFYSELFGSNNNTEVPK